MKRLFILVSVAIPCVILLVGRQVLAAGKYRFVFVSHAGEENPFWATVYMSLVDGLHHFLRPFPPLSL
ncbi:MAG: hypothetical protein ACUVQZ_10075, partial [Candidatus Caldatribacteriaceae bacterium]